MSPIYVLIWKVIQKMSLQIKKSNLAVLTFLKVLYLSCFVQVYNFLWKQIYVIKFCFFLQKITFFSLSKWNLCRKKTYPVLTLLSLHRELSKSSNNRHISKKDNSIFTAQCSYNPKKCSWGKARIYGFFNCNFFLKDINPYKRGM